MHFTVVLNKKKEITLLILSILTATMLCASDWTLGGMKFTFTQHDTRTTAQTGVATLLPQLILEQIASGSSRVPTNKEMLDRTLDDLLTKRISLFLQLSKEVKTRDSLVLSEPNQNALKKKIAAEDQKIADIEQQIKDNLNQAAQAKKEAEPAIKDEEKRAADMDANNKNQSASNEIVENEQQKEPNFFEKLFIKKEKIVNLPTTENVSLYKKDNTTLFTPSDTVAEAGIKSREFEKAVTAEKINGLLTGSIIVYGEYAAVTVELIVYPGIKTIGVITEVGTISDCQQMAINIARYLSPKIANSMPIKLLFDIQPEEAAVDVKITIDGLVYGTVSEPAVINAGIHTVVIESKGYNPQSVTWNFSDRSFFLIHAALTEVKQGQITIALKQPLFGTFYANGAAVGETGVGLVSAPVSVNGQPVIGQFLTKKKTVKKVSEEVTDKDGNKTTVEKEEEGSYIGSFFYIPDTFAVPDSTVVINPKTVDNATVIDARRIWMYRGYSALIVSLPFAFYAYGNFDAMYKAYTQKMITNITELKDWQKKCWVTIGISCVAGTFFVVELVRYLKAADAVIPTTVKKAKSGEVEKSLESSQSIVEKIDDSVLPDELKTENESDKKQTALPDDSKTSDESDKKQSTSTDDSQTTETETTAK
jgi:hypothetical protein